jgi:hypothetical protein
MQQRHRVHLKIAIEHFRIDFHEIAERTTHRVVDEHSRNTQFASHCVNHGIELVFLSNVTGIAFGVREFAFQGF